MTDNRARLQELRAAAQGWTVNAAYRDPLAAIDPQYDRRWLAAQMPVRHQHLDTGLVVIVQESYDQIIGQPLGEMRRGLLLLSLATLLLSAMMIVPLWGLVLRLVR